MTDAAIWTTPHRTITLTVEDYNLLDRMLDGLRDQQYERLSATNAPSKEDMAMYEFLKRATVAVKQAR